MLRTSTALKRAFSLSQLHHVPKFYKEVNVAPFVDPTATHEGFTVKLDTKTLSTADGHRYFVPSALLAHVVCLEFAAQQDYIVINSMPLFGLTKSAVDFVHSKLLQQNSVSRLCRFIKGDTACIRDPNPKLRTWQEERAQPIVELFKKKFDIEMKPVTNLHHETVKDEKQGEKLREYLLSLNPWQLIAAEVSVSTVRSVSLGLLAVTGAITTEEALFISRLEEEYQAIEFGKVDGAHDIDETLLLTHLTAPRLLFLNSSPN